MNKSEQRLAGIGYGLLAALIWGGFPVVTRLGVAHSPLDPYDIAFIRFLVAGALLAPLLLRRGLGGVSAGAAALMIAGVGAPYILAVATALTHAPASYFALTPGSMIAFTAVLGRFLVNETLRGAQKAGILTVLVGMALAAYTALSGNGGWLAIVLFVVGGFLWAIYNITAKRCAVGALQATTIVSVGSALLYLPCYVAFRGLAIVHAPLGAIAIQAFYQGVMVSILGLYFFSKAVTILGPALGATFGALVPLLATVEAALLLGEKPGLFALAGIFIVTVGMITSLINPRRAVASPR